MTIEEDDKLLNDTAEDDQKSDDWNEKLLASYENLHAVVLDNIPDMWKPLEFALSVKSILNIEGCTIPFAGIILGPPGSLKTTTIQLFRGCQNVFYTDGFTAKSLVSHNSAVKKDKLKEIDMLPKMKDKLFLTPELAPIFSSRDEELLEILAILTRVLDGHGLENDTGAQGHRGYSGDYMFTWVGAAVDVPYKVQKHLSVLGPKLYFYRLPPVEHTEADYLYYMKNVSDNFPDRINKIREALIEYQAVFESKAEMEGLLKIPVNNDSKEDRSIDEYVVRLAVLLSRLRAVVPTWQTRDTQGSDYAYEIAIIEDPYRAITQLKNLARGHALSQGRQYMTVEDDLKVVIETVLSTGTIERTVIFDLLIANGGRLTSSDIVNLLNTTRPTALRTMTELKATGLVETYEERGVKGMILLDGFNWFLSEEFKALKEGRKEKHPPRNPILLLLYRTIINKKHTVDGNILNDCVRGGENSLQDIPQESWRNEPEPKAKASQLGGRGG